MEFQCSKGDDMSADLTPMLDCMFQLLIFFLLSSSFLTPTLRLDLPRLKVDEPATKPGILVSIDAENRLFLNRERIPIGELSQRVRAEFTKQNKREVVFKAHRELEYGNALKVLVILRKADANPIHLAYELKSSR